MSMPSTLALGQLQRSIEMSMPSTLALGGLQRSIEASMPSTLAFSGLQRSIEMSMPSTLALGGLQGSIEASMPSTLVLGGLQRSIEMSMPTRRLTPLWDHTTPEFLSAFRMRGKLNRTGWFPHSTFPTHLLSYGYDDEELDKAVLTYYRTNWPMVRRNIEDELSLCHVDDNAKESLRQALTAHENGLYRIVPPSLFSFIEGAVRVCLYDNKVGNFSVKHQLESELGSLPATVLLYGALGVVAYSQLSQHLYESIQTNSARERFLLAPLPNRHATVHGLVVYSSEKSSLNTIFVAIYVFRGLSVLMARKLRGGYS